MTAAAPGAPSPSPRWLGRLRRAARGATAHPVLRGAYEALVHAEVAAARVAASGRRVSPVDPGTVTLAIKAFERPELLRRMLRSVRAVYSGPILVADDSATPFVSDDPAVRVLALPFDSGVAAGRNALIDAASTEYLWMADDDMILLPDFDLARTVAYLDRNAEVDLCGGRVVNLPQFSSADYLNSGLFAYGAAPRRPRGTLIDGLAVSDKVPNFYVARTAALRGVRYDDRLKRVDHTDFFTSAYGRLLCVVEPRMVCLHARSYFDPRYLAFRQDTAADSAYLAAKWGSGGVEEGHADLDAAQLALLHHAALQVVADDLGVRIVHAREPDAVTIGLARGDLARFEQGLDALGWRASGSPGAPGTSGAGRRRLSPVWGAVALDAGASFEEASAGAVAAEFASVRGLAAGPGVWPEPQPPASGEAAEGVRHSERAGWLAVDDGVVVAALPLGPVYAIAPPGDLIWQVVGPGGEGVDAVVAEVASAFEEVPEGADAQIRDFLDVMVARGLLVRTPA